MTEYIFDNHSHSKHSFDGSGEINEICQSAIEKGACGIAITDHCDLGIYYTENWRENFAALQKDIISAREIYGDRLKISFGIELGQPLHDEKTAAEVLAAYNYDVVLGSIHNVKDNEDFYFLQDKEVDRKKLADLYYAEELELARKNNFDILAHLTYAYRYLGHGTGMPEPQQYEELLRELFKTLIQNGKALEVNASGVYKTPQLEIMPQLWELKLYKECGGELVTLASDSHKPRFITGGNREGRELLRAAGFKYQAFYQNRKPEMFPL